MVFEQGRFPGHGFRLRTEQIICEGMLSCNRKMGRKLVGRHDVGDAMRLLTSGLIFLSLAAFCGVAHSETGGTAAASASQTDAKTRHVNATAENSQLIVTPDYILGPEDVLEIAVWKNNDLSKQVQVRPDGRISLPLVGDVSAVGKTPSQLTDEISSRLKAYMENPTVSILVKEVKSYQIYVLGEVNKPGKYPLTSKLTLLQAITVAGGFTQVAARNKIVVFRYGKDTEALTKIKASYDDMVIRDGSNQNIELRPGDLIVVPSETMVVLPSR
ncbi:MAG TPA: polysaccharide biosynthesis/export family protein [Nitrospiraceae bacterium]|nr:polysaccharide biosynthesis/export family protein [Nitrospiraceae bacterium]